MKDIVVPELAESITEGTIVAWLKEEGDPVEAGESVLELETDKINVEIPADYSGVLTEQMAEVGDDVEVGAVIGKIDTEAEASAPAPAKEESTEQEEAPAETKSEQSAPSTQQEAAAASASAHEDPSGAVLDTPSARKKARETGEEVRLSEPASGSKEQPKEKTSQSKPAAAQAPQETTSSDKPVEVIKMSRRRRTIADRLVEAQQTTAMLTTFNEVDMSAIMELRKEVQEAFVEKHDVKLGYMSIFSKAVIGALKQFPYVNSEIKEDEIHLKKYYNIGIAVSTEEGLVVPVVKNADKMNFAEIEHEIKNLSTKARDGKLTLDDMQDGTFTITNGGVFGSLFSTPILNAPQVGILGMHGIFDRQVVDKDGNAVVKPMMYIALSYDHRVIDGRDSVSFLRTVKELLEDPKKLLLEG